MKMLQRYTDSERMTHWVVAVSFVLAALSGLAFFHPSLFFLSNLFGGGPWTRILHPFIGLVMVLAFLRLAAQHWHDNRPAEGDRAWLEKSRELFAGKRKEMPPVGKFNPGQKRMFRLLVACTLLALLSGLVIWRPWFAPYFSVTVLRAAVLVHAVAATLLVLTIIGHVYMAIWTKGAIRAMTRGTVPETWAKMHHANWHREVTQGK